MSNSLPETAKNFKTAFPDVWNSFVGIGRACHTAGPLDERSRRLVKLALAFAAGLEGAAHSAIRNALDKGLTPEEIRHVAILGVTTLGFPASMRAMTWIDDEVETD